MKPAADLDHQAISGHHREVAAITAATNEALAPYEPQTFFEAHDLAREQAAQDLRDNPSFRSLMEAVEVQASLALEAYENGHEAYRGIARLEKTPRGNVQEAAAWSIRKLVQWRGVPAKPTPEHTAKDTEGIQVQMFRYAQTRHLDGGFRLFFSIPFEVNIAESDLFRSKEFSYDVKWRGEDMGTYTDRFSPVRAAEEGIRALMAEYGYPEEGGVDDEQETLDGRRNGLVFFVSPAEATPVIEQ